MKIFDRIRVMWRMRKMLKVYLIFGKGLQTVSTITLLSYMAEQRQLMPFNMRLFRSARVSGTDAYVSGLYKSLRDTVEAGYMVDMPNSISGLVTITRKGEEFVKPLIFYTAVLSRYNVWISLVTFLMALAGIIVSISK